MRQQHTEPEPGPYFVQRASDRDTFVIKPIPGPIIAEVEPLPNAEATARLLAAAWEMRDVLREVLASAHPHPVEHPTMTAAWAKVRAVLAKVEG
jgi:hypothetical protein